MDALFEISLSKGKEKDCAASLHCQGYETIEWSFQLPWIKTEEWQLVYCYLAAFRHLKPTWPSDQSLVEQAEQKGWTSGNKPLIKRIEEIGECLYDHIFDQEKRQFFAEILNKAKQEAHQIAKFTFTSKDSFLLSYPWETLHDGNTFLFKNPDVTLVRTLKLNDIPPKALPQKQELKLLVVSPNHEHPDYYLQKQELTFIKETFVKEKNKGQLLGTANNYQQFLDRLATFEPTALHIDTHGEYGALCPSCDAFLSIEILKKGEDVKCSNPSCSSTLDYNRLEKRGYILFIEEEGGLKWVSGEELGDILSTKHIKLITLSICKSGQVGNGSAFNSIAGALLRRGFQAVIAMNYKVEQESSAFFTKALYSSLLNYKPLPHALANARIAFQNVGDAWYRPVLYFQAPQSLVSEPLFQSLKRRRKNLGSVSIEHNQDIEFTLSQEDIGLLKIIVNSKIRKMEEYLRSSGKRLLLKLGYMDSFNVLFAKEATTSLLKGLKAYVEKLNAFESSLHVADIHSDHFYGELLGIKKGLSKIIKYEVDELISSTGDVRMSTKAHVYQNNLDTNRQELKRFISDFISDHDKESECRTQLENLIASIKSDCSTFIQILNELHQLAEQEEKVILN